MKVLIIQENGHHEANRNYRECFCLQRGFEHNGAEADVWGKLHNNFEKTPDWDSYDLIFAIENWDWMPNLSKVKAKKFMWAIDAHCKGAGVYDKIAHDNNFDAVFHATPSFTTPDYWLPNCYDDTLIKPLETKLQDVRIHNVGFCGNIANRKDAIDYMIRNYQMRFDEMVIGDSMVRAVNSYKLHWNMNISNDINYRNFETMGCRTCLLTSSHPYYEALGFRDGNNVLMWRNGDELHELILKALKDEEWREAIARNGHELAKKYHTYKHRANRILEIIK